MEESAGHRVEVFQVASKSLVKEKRAPGKPLGKDCPRHLDVRLWLNKCEKVMTQN